MPDDAPSPPLSPSAFLESVAARLDRLHGADTAPVLIRGVPVKTGGTSKEYGGFLYAQVKDARTGEGIDAKVPIELAGRLEWGREAVLVGLIHYRAKRGEVRPEFRIDSVQEAGSLRLPGKSELLERWSAAASRPKRDV